MLAVRLSKELEAKLDKIALATNRSKSYYVKKAIEHYLVDKIDYLEAAARLEEKNSTVSWNEVRDKLELDDKS
jgi:RHH-type rel operon transcriptional repressor/antitoxin RelB